MIQYLFSLPPQVQTLHALNRNSRDLLRLDLGSGVNILPDYLSHNTIGGQLDFMQPYLDRC